MKKPNLIFGIIILTVLFSFGIYSVFASDSGALSPGTMADSDVVGTMAWANPNNAKVSDNVYTSSSGGGFPFQSHYLKATNFGFAIPTGATINGILVEIERYNAAHASKNVKDKIVKIVKSDGTLGTENKANTVDNWPDADAYASYGGATNLWSETWTPADINDVDFGVVLSAEALAGSMVVYVDHIRITVYYTEATTGNKQVQIKTGKMSIQQGRFQIAQ